MVNASADGLRLGMGGGYVARTSVQEIAMRKVIAAAAMIVLAAIEAHAGQRAPWCAWLSGYQGFISDCSYFTLAQCRATISGNGGYCAPNPNARPPRDGQPYRHAQRPSY